jgi:hypothetical protein
MSTLRRLLHRSHLALLIVLCLAALTATSVYAGGEARPLAATDLIGSPDAAVNGKFAVGSAAVGSKALTVTGVIDFLGAGTVHNYFTQGGGNNMQINTNVDEGNTVGDISRSQWKLVLGSALDWFSIRRSPAGGTYNEDALFFIQGSTGNVGIATVDTGNGATIPFTPQARLDVETPSGNAVYGLASATTGYTYGVYGQSSSTDGTGLYGFATATTGNNNGVIGHSNSTNGNGVYGLASASTGISFGVYGRSSSTDGRGVFGAVDATTGINYGVFGASPSTSGRGVFGYATATTGIAEGVLGQSQSTNGYGVNGEALSTVGTNYGVRGISYSSSGTGVEGYAWATTGVNYGVYGITGSPSGYGVYSQGNLYANGNFTATGVKSAIVDTQDYGWRSLYAMESPQNWFEDFGQATLTAGEAVVKIEPIFAQTVNLGEPYHVFLTPLAGGCTLFVADKSSTSFTVRANEGAGCEIAFDYRIIAPRLDYEDLRLKPAADPQAVAASMPEPPSAPEGPQAP